MRKLILAAVAGTAFALAGCSEKPAEEATEAAVEATEAASDVAVDASAAPSEVASEAAAM